MRLSRGLIQIDINLFLALPPKLEPIETNRAIYTQQLTVRGLVYRKKIIIADFGYKFEQHPHFFDEQDGR